MDCVVYDDVVGLGVEFVASSPASMACGDVAKVWVFYSFGDFKGYGEGVGVEEVRIVLSCHFHYVAGVEKGLHPLLLGCGGHGVVAGIGF